MVIVPAGEYLPGRHIVMTPRIPEQVTAFAENFEEDGVWRAYLRQRGPLNIAGRWMIEGQMVCVSEVSGPWVCRSLFCDENNRLFLESYFRKEAGPVEINISGGAVSMTLSDVLARLVVNTGLGPANFADQIRGLVTTIYNGPSAAAAQIQAWLNADGSRQIVVDFKPHDAAAGLNVGHVLIDPSFFEDNLYFSTKGIAVRDTILSGFAHELSHAVTTNDDKNSPSYSLGDNVVNANVWFNQVGLAEQPSYQAYDRFADVL